MNDEIKEILDYLKDEDEYYKKAEEVIVGYGDLIVEKEDIDKLLDYITNLQQKIDYYENFEINKTVDKIRLENNKQMKQLQQANERLKQGNELVTNKLIDVTNKMVDYKSRCEKVIEYLEKHKDKTGWVELAPYTTEEPNLLDLFNILNGDDKSGS